MKDLPINPGNNYIGEKRYVTVDCIHFANNSFKVILCKKPKGQRHNTENDAHKNTGKN